jgi:eukaryotic-like serine/threonine-protein kinase
MSMIGKTLAHYEITNQLGKGGMGEVYQAKDQKLGRDVAIKVLPEEFAKDADRVARFQREAKLLASLNHPNIAAIHGLEEASGTNFLVLELVEGQTLADRIKAGPVPVEEALKLALQIAEALEAAHEKGIIHRDLKPANIKVTPDGKVKVLDFGLAKAFAGDQADLNPSTSPTLTRSPTLSDMATQQGVILGTAAYMSPEQARGKVVDKRADIWAFGCVLYEMLTGQATFQGEDVTEILAAVVKLGVNLDLLPANIHPKVREVITRCLQKDLKSRYQDIGDVRYEIGQALADPSGVWVQPIAAVKPRKKLRTLLPWIAAIILSGIIVGVVVWKARTPEPPQVTRFVHYLTEGQQFANQAAPFLAVSPNGRQFVYCTSKGLYLRSMEELDIRLISSANDNPTTPFFSPDGQWVGYLSLADNKLKKVSINGGPPVRLCDVSGDSVVGASWGADDTIVYGAREGGKGIMRVSASGGIPEMLIPRDKEIFYHPRLLPGGKSVMFTLGTNEGYKIVVQSLESRERKVLFKGDCAWYVPTGYIIYALDYDLYAVPFDLDTLQPGAPIPVVEGLFRQRPSYAPQYAVSVSGALIYLPKAITAAATERALVWVDRMGKEDPLNLPPRIYHNPRISPDGKQVALDSEMGGSSSIWIWDLIRETMTRLTPDAVDDAVPLWTPNGQRIIFASSRRGRGSYELYSKAANGTGEVEKIGSFLDSRYNFPCSWADKNGSTLILLNTKKGYEAESDIGMLSMEGKREMKELLQEKYNELEPQVSPDRRYVAYQSDESGKGEIYVRSFPDVNKGKWPVSTGGGSDPLWSPDGRELFYRNADAFMAASVKTEPTFSIEKPKVLFEGKYIMYEMGMRDLNPWDIHPDGKRFLLMKEGRSTASPAGDPRTITIVLNWLEELKQRVSVP